MFTQKLTQMITAALFTIAHPSPQKEINVHQLVVKKKGGLPIQWYIFWPYKGMSYNLDESKNMLRKIRHHRSQTVIPFL